VNEVKKNKTEGIKLDGKDWKILNQLDLNSRQSDSEIGKKTRISKQVVNYRIKKLEEDGVILGFFPHINVPKLGYLTHKIYLRFRSLNKQNEEEILNYLKKQEKIVWVILCSGRWDLIFGVASESISEFDKVLDGFMNLYSEFVAERGISVFNKATIHHRKWLIDDKNEVSWKLGGKKEEIDEIDRKILVELEKNARVSVIDMAEKARISSTLVIQRIKKLREKDVIGAFRLSLNREKLGIHYCKAFIYYQNKTTEKEEKLLKYVYSLNEILGVSKSIGSWDLELEFEVKSYDDFHKIMKELKNKFDIISSFDTGYIEKELGESFMPKIHMG